MSDLPEGNPYAKFQSPVDEANPYARFGSPATLATAPAQPAAPSFAERLWKSITGDVGAVTGFAKGAAEGITGEGVPKGPASQFEGGQPGFAGRALGTGARSVAESLWENIVKAPGKMMTGEMQPGPEAEAAARGTAMGMAGVGGWAPGRALPGLAERPPGFTLGGSPPVRPPPPGQLLLPPPTMGAAGQPATSTGEGMLPPGPASTMTRPEASPPPTSPRVAAGLEPEPPTYPQPRPPAPEPPPRNPSLDAQTVSLYRQAVLPRTQRGRNAQITQQEGNIVTGVDKIIENRPNLRLTDPAGVELPPGTAPQNMRQFSEAIEQSKTALFEKWNPMAEQAGEAGLQIELAPVVAELRSLATKPKITGVNPGVVRQLEEFANIYERQGAYTPLEAQEVIKGINRRLASFYEKGEAASGAPAEVLEPVARLLRKQLDEGIENTVGPGWQQLRNDYGALNAIEGDVTKAVQRIANKPNSGLASWANMLGSAEFIHGVVMMNPHALWRAIGLKGSGELHKFINDPNRMIARLFDRRVAGPPQPPSNAAAPLTRGVVQPAMTYRLSQPSGVGVPLNQGEPHTSIGGP